MRRQKVREPDSRQIASQALGRSASFAPRGIRPEDRLLLACAGAPRTSLPAAGPRFDWDRFLQEAIRHGIIPLVHRQLEHAPPQSVPDGFAGKVAGLFRENAMRSLLLSAELARVVDVFDKNGVRALPLRGPVLARQLYRDPAMRFYADLDLLIQPGDAVRASLLLLREGYKTASNVSDSALRSKPTTSVKRSFARKDAGVYVEIQWAISPRRFSFAVDLDYLRPRLRRVELVGRKFPAVAGEDLLMLLCMHGTNHRWERLAWLADVAAVVRSGRVRWVRLLDESRRLGISRMVLLGVSLAESLLGATLPAVARRAVRCEPSLRALRAIVRRELFRTADERARRPGRFVFYMRALEKPGDKLRYLLTPGSEDRVPSGAPIILSYLTRPFRLLAQYAPFVTRQFLK